MGKDILELWLYYNFLKLYKIWHQTSKPTSLWFSISSLLLQVLCSVNMNVKKKYQAFRLDSPFETTSLKSCRWFCFTCNLPDLIFHLFVFCEGFPFFCAHLVNSPCITSHHHNSWITLTAYDEWLAWHAFKNPSLAIMFIIKYRLSSREPTSSSLISPVIYWVDQTFFFFHLCTPGTCNICALYTQKHFEPFCFLSSC